MSDLHSLLADNYNRHASFNSSVAPFVADDKKVQSFNQDYRSLIENWRNNSPNIRIKLKESALFTLQEIFEDFGRQAVDGYERAFVNELANECKRLARVEFEGIQNKTTSRRFSKKYLDPNLFSALKNQRYFFTTLSKEVVDEILLVAEPALKTFRANAGNGKVTREDLSLNQGPLVSKIVKTLDRFYEKSGINHAISAYNEIPMKVSGLALEMSVPSASWWKNKLDNLERAPHTLYAHLDEDIHTPKSIVYLSNVNAHTGPTSCYPGIYESMSLTPLQEIIGRVISNPGGDPSSPLHSYYAKSYHQSIGSENFRKHFMRLPQELRFNSHMGWDVKPDSSLENEFVKSEKVMTGPAGTALVFDGARLFHRGGLLEQGERVVLQVIFGRKRTLFSRLKSKLGRIFRR